jgi:hypothetical protein
MFDLELAIAQWRQQMLAAGVKAPVPLEELEAHLREDIEQQVRAGTEASRAFEIAVRHIGGAVELKKEFKKTGNAKWMFLRKLRGFLLGAGEIPLPALDNFEPAARRTLELAPEEARHFHHTFVGTEHILLGLARSESKSLSNVMQRLGVSTAAVRREIEQIVTAGTGASTLTTIPFTPRARRALRLAAQEAKGLSDRQVRAEHVFLGLLREGGGVAAMVLKKLGVRAENARAEILKEISPLGGAH